MKDGAVEGSNMQPRLVNAVSVKGRNRNVDLRCSDLRGCILTIFKIQSSKCCRLLLLKKVGNARLGESD